MRVKTDATKMDDRVMAVLQSIREHVAPWPRMLEVVGNFVHCLCRIVVRGCLQQWTRTQCNGRARRSLRSIRSNLMVPLCLHRDGQTFDKFAPAGRPGPGRTAFRLELSIGTDLGFSIASRPCWAQTLRSSEAGRLRPLREFKRYQAGLLLVLEALLAATAPAWAAERAAGSRPPERSVSATSRELELRSVRRPSQ